MQDTGGVTARRWRHRLQVSPLVCFNTGMVNLSLLAHGGAQTECMLNGQPIDCGELAQKAEPFIGLGLGLLAIAATLMIASFVFWLLMLIHAIQHDSPDRTIWIIVLLVALVTGFALIGAIVYFFAERKKAEGPAVGPPAQTTPTPISGSKPAAPRQDAEPKDPAQQ